MNSFIPKNPHKSWHDFLTNDVVNEIDTIQKQITGDFCPSSPAAVLRFLEVDLHKVSVVWLGQDVYPQEGVATGRSFEIGGLTQWSTPFKQTSMRNIVRAVYAAENEIEEYEEIPTFKQILVRIENGEFPLAPPNEWFNALENQGVLFLNRSFTCETGKPNSHELLWQVFAQKVIQYVSTKNVAIAWFLWGNEAKKAQEWIVGGTCYTSRHPMMISNKYPDDFLKFAGFKETKQKINWLG
ncbi:MAG: uracil-DNA glycosylase [Bacilli bacterium]